LLQRFVALRDEDAFTSLMLRHGPMVLGVCRRVLGNSPDADDAFQATFLVLVRKAASVRNRNSLGSWLYSVAVRIARNARVSAMRRSAYERQAIPMRQADNLDEAVWRDLRPLLDAELERLPEKYRAPLVLCYLEGHTHEEAARKLGWTNGTVCGRLARAKAMLRARLVRRGLAPSAALLTAALSKEATAAIPTALFETTLKAALGCAAGTGIVAAPVAALTKGALNTMFWSKCKAALLVVATLGLLFGAGGIARQALSARPAEEKPTPLVKEKENEPEKKEAAALRDLLGDPLPPGALARLGTGRMRHEGEVRAVAFSGDGKTVIGAGKDRKVRFWDAATGKEASSVQDKETDDWYCVAVSPDGKTLAMSGEVRETNPEDKMKWAQKIILCDATTGKELRRLPSGWVRARALTFSPDSKTLAAGNNLDVVLWDVAKGEKLLTLSGFNGTVECIAFTPDGKLVAGGGQDYVNQGVVRFWDTATGKEAGAPLKRAGSVQALAFSPDGKTLAVGGSRSESSSDDDVLTLWDVAARKQTGLLPSYHKFSQGPVGTLAYSRDGKTLASARRWTVHLWDTATGKEKHLFILNPLPAAPGQVALSPDGKTLAAACGLHVRLWDVETGKEPDWQTGPCTEIRHLAYTPDGKTLALAAELDETIYVWDVGTGKQRHRLVGHDGPIGSLAVSSDGKTLATTGAYDRTARLWDLATGKETLRLDKKKEGGHCEVALSPAGDVLVLGGVGEGLTLYSRTTGRELRRLCGTTFSQARPAAFSPDGKFYAAVSGTDVFVREVATGKVVYEFMQEAMGSFHWITLPGKGPALVWGAGDDSGTYIWDPEGKERKLGSHFLCGRDRVSPDGRMAARVEFEVSLAQVRIWEVTTGRKVAVFQGPEKWRAVPGDAPTWFRDLAFSPDGRMLVTSDADHRLQLWEASTGKEIRHWGGPQILSHPLRQPIVFAPDGRTIATSDGDTILVWDVTGRAQAGGLKQLDLKPQERDRLWGDLAGENVPKAHDALWAFVAAGDSVVPFFAERLLPEVNARRLAQLIADLDGEEFAAREKATAELEKLNVSAEAALRRTLKDRPSLETRRRIEALLEKAERWNVVAGRALQVLEQIGTAEARKVFEALAKGDPEARLVQDARTSLERLKKRP
jgi:RNA polymerase sigma factor (sigma-70 family)